MPEISASYREKTDTEIQRIQTLKSHKYPLHEGVVLLCILIYISLWWDLKYQETLHQVETGKLVGQVIIRGTPRRRSQSQRFSHFVSDGWHIKVKWMCLKFISTRVLHHFGSFLRHSVPFLSQFFHLFQPYCMTCFCLPQAPICGHL